MSRDTIANILKRNGIESAPDRVRKTTWKEFLTQHWELLVAADFRFVKLCEDEACVLWFWDQTKSHRRRWCSAMLCGNRHKVAAYRRRLRGEDA